MSDRANYSDLVREAFIDPIRSVMIIDDQYPTWEEILDEERWTQDKDGSLVSPTKPKEWWTDRNGPRGVLKQFRGRDKGLMIDIHDGQPPDVEPEKIASFLHQSDLLVLDYQLEGETLGGDRAQDLAKHLLNENHFNLIVVHTNKENLFEPFSEILLRLLSKCASEGEYEDRVDNGETAIDEVDNESLADELRNQFTHELYLVTRHPTCGKSAIGQLFAGTAPFDKVKTLLEENDIKVSNFKDVLAWLMKDFEQRASGVFANDNSDGLNWSAKEGCLWIRTDRGFIAFANKKKTDNLLKCLREALEDWQPSPSRLLSAKFRHSIDEYGVVAEDKALSKRHVYAKFYHDIKSAEIQKRGALLDNHVVRQAERVTAEIQQNIRDFGLAIGQIDDNSPDSVDLSKHYGVNLQNNEEANKAVRHYNHHVSCIPVHGYHLTSGHIFEMNEKKWVVVSAACDMVPGQRQMGFEQIHENHRPFVALQLYKNRNTLTDTEINSGNFIFLETDEDVEVYCTFPKSSDPVEQLPKVTWNNFIALNKGILADEYAFDLLAIDARKEEIESTKHSVKIIAQLRYEFALNLIHRLGTTMTRIGLSFVGKN